MRFTVVVAFALLAGCLGSDTPPGGGDSTVDVPSDPPSAPDPDAAAPEEGTTVVLADDGKVAYETTTWTDAIDLTLQYGVPFAPYDQQDPERFQLDEHVVAVLLEVAWDDTTMDLNAYAVPATCPEIGSPETDPECEVGVTTRTSHWYEDRDGMPGNGDSPSIVFLDHDVLAGECLPCSWTFGAHAMAAAANVVATISVTLFYGPVPDGFTALPA